MTSGGEVAVFFQSVAKDPDKTKQKSYLTSDGSHPRKADFARYSSIFRL
jgi:hypothetical protein